MQKFVSYSRKFLFPTDFRVFIFHRHKVLFSREIHGSFRRAIARWLDSDPETSRITLCRVTELRISQRAIPDCFRIHRTFVICLISPLHFDLIKLRWHCKNAQRKLREWKKNRAEPNQVTGWVWPCFKLSHSYHKSVPSQRMVTGAGQLWPIFRNPYILPWKWCKQLLYCLMHLFRKLNFLYKRFGLNLPRIVFIATNHIELQLLHSVIETFLSYECPKQHFLFDFSSLINPANDSLKKFFTKQWLKPNGYL